MKVREMVNLRVGLRFLMLVIKQLLLPHIEEVVEGLRSWRTSSVLEKMRARKLQINPTREEELETLRGRD